MGIRRLLSPLRYFQHWLRLPPQHRPNYCLQLPLRRRGFHRRNQHRRIRLRYVPIRLRRPGYGSLRRVRQRRTLRW